MTTDTPQTIRGGWLTLNRSCNFRCSWCYQQDTKFDPKKTMTIELARKLIDLFIASGAKNVVLIGGEPTTYPDLPEVISRLVAGGIRPILVTNGRELSNPSYLQTLFEVGLRDINVSMKGADEEGFQEMTRTRNSYGKVRDGIRNVLATEINISVSVVIEDYFIRNADKFIDLLQGLGVPHINFDLGSPVLLEAGTNAASIPNPFVLADAVEYVHYKMKAHTQSYSFYLTIPLCILDAQVRDELIAQKKITTSCHVSKGTSAIFTEDGSVIPCNHFTSQSYGQFGRDFQTPNEFSEFWKNDAIANFRSHFNSFPHQNCATCEFWTICGGGCKVKWMHHSPADFIGKPRPTKPKHLNYEYTS